MNIKFIWALQIIQAYFLKDDLEKTSGKLPEVKFIEH